MRKSKLISIGLALYAAVFALSIPGGECINDSDTTIIYAAEVSGESLLKTKTTKDESGNSFITVTGITESAADVVIPSQIGGVPVTGISENAFKGDSTIKHLTLSEGIISVGYAAFAQCSQLKTVEIPDSVTDVCKASFFETPWLSSQSADYVTVGSGVLIDYRGDSESVIIPSQVKSIAKEAFAGNMTIKNVIIGHSVKSIGDYTFAGCTGLQSVKLSSSTESIGNFAFFDTGLKSVIIPKNINSIGKYAFGYKNDTENGFAGSVWGYKITGYNDSEAQKYAQAAKTDFTAYADVRDLNGDCRVNTEDIFNVKKFLILSKTDYQNFGDVNNNGETNVFDLVRIKQQALTENNITEGK